MTLVGKVLLYILMVTSVAGFGLAIWLFVDHRDWKAEEKALTEEIRKRQGAYRAEELALNALLNERGRGGQPGAENRPIQFPDVAKGQPHQLAPLKPIPVREARVQLKKDQEDITDATDRTVASHEGLLKTIEEVKSERVKTMAAIQESERLRQVLANTGGPKPYRELIEDARQGKQAAEREQETLRPQLVNALVELELLLKRNQQLSKRLEELKPTAGSAGSGAL